MIRNATHCRRWLTIVVVGGICLFSNDYFLRFAARRNPATRVNYLLTAQPRKDHVVILGSSMLASAISTRQLSRSIAGNTIQLSVGGQGVQEQSLVWECYLSRHHCDLLLLELNDETVRHNPGLMSLRADRYAAHLDNEIIRRHVKNNNGLLQTAAWGHVPMWAFAQFSSKIGWPDWIGYLKTVAYDSDAPSIYSAGPVPTRAQLVQQQLAFEQRPAALNDPSAVAALQSILDMADREEITVVILEPPMFDGGNRQQTVNAGSIDLSTRVRLRFSSSIQEDERLFDDRRHASELGSRQFTQELSEMIANLPQ